MADIDAFIQRWQAAEAKERANYQLFLTELCTLLDIEGPRPSGSDYAFEYAVTFNHPDGSTTTGHIDLYKKGCFVLEAKQGTEKRLQADLPLFGETGSKSAGVERGSRQYRLLMQSARQQAERYAKSLPTSHGWPPILMIVDVGHSIECFADFSATGKNYSQFPDAQRFRIKLED